MVPGSARARNSSLNNFINTHHPIEPNPQTLFPIIQAHGRSCPEALAILSPDKKPISYGQLASHLEATALRLSQLGFRRGDRVAVSLPNTPEMATLYLAVSSVCACAPLNPSFLVDDFTASMTDLNAKALVTLRGEQNHSRTAALRSGIPILELDPNPDYAGLFTLISDIAVDTAISEFVPAELDDVALALQTSGTSSRPKIVPMTHRNIYYSLNNNIDIFALTSADRCLNLMPLFHIGGLVAVTLASMAVGASVIYAPGFISYKVMDWLVELSPSWYAATPAVHKAILDQAHLQPEKVKQTHLRCIRSASSPLAPSIIAELEAVFAAHLLETYGMTEASSAVASTRLPPYVRKAGSVGLPPGSSRVCIMDEAGNMLSTNTLGEICIGGENVIAGYENNPVANAASYVNGWLRTGDLGYLDEDGYIFITDRVKEIINRGGEKVSPREVDATLLRHPAVKQAATFAIPHPTLGEDVAAAVVLQAGQTVSMQELRQFAASHLTDYKIPRQIVFLKEIPKNALGKIQRTGLAGKLKAELESLRGREAGQESGPRTESESAIQLIWQEVLNVQVGIHDDFLVLGGDSLRAARILLQINERFDTDLQIGDIFDAPTVASMAAIVQSQMERG